MLKKFVLFITLLMVSASLCAQSRVFDTSRPDRLLTFGVRAGINSSGLDNNYLSAQPEMIRNNFYWRMGGQIGGSVDLYLRNFLSIQTGFFWRCSWL